MCLYVRCVGIKLTFHVAGGNLPLTFSSPPFSCIWRYATVTAAVLAPSTHFPYFHCRYLEAYSSAAAMLEGPSAAAAAAADVALSVKSSKTAALVDLYTEKNRAKSLVEQHQEKLKEEAKQRKKKQKTGKEESEAKEWRLWDREKDLEIKPKAMQLTGKTLGGGLSSRFGGSQAGSRTFL